MLIALLLAVSAPSLAGAQEGPIALDPQHALVQVRENGGITEQTSAIVAAAAALNYAQVTTLHRVTLRSWAVQRGDMVIHAAPEGFGYPLLTGAIDPALPVLPSAARIALSRAQVVMGEQIAALRGAAVGDTIDLEPLSGGSIRLTIGAVVPDGDIFHNELIVSPSLGTELGIDRPFALLVHSGALDRVEAVLRGSLFRPEVRVLGGSATDSTDSVLTIAQVKARFGEFAIRDAGGDAVEIDPAWLDANIVEVELPQLGLFRCHRLVVPYVRGVISELTRSGVIDLIDPADFQVAGGCFNPRFNRGGDPGYSLSRHSWGIAIDINPSTNSYGATPSLSASVIEAFRRWGFSWGGTWGVPDGMHFEWHHFPSSYASDCADLTVTPLYAGGLWYLRPTSGDCS